MKRDFVPSTKITLSDMGKTVENLNALSDILNNTNEAEVVIDSAPVEFKRGPGRPRKKPQEYNIWCGLQTPAEIYNVCVYLKGLLEDQNKYSKALDIQIFNCAVQFFLYNDLITKTIEKREIVPVRALTTTSESFRRALQSLGLTVTDKKQGVSKEDTEVNPMAAFVDAINSDTEDVVLKKKSKKGKGA